VTEIDNRKALAAVLDLNETQRKSSLPKFV
jgi:hypothetical protein